MILKYIRFKASGFYAFATDLFHAFVCDKIGKREDVLSAGYIANGRCGGESETLGVSSKSEDHELLERQGCKKLVIHEGDRWEWIVIPGRAASKES